MAVLVLPVKSMELEVVVVDLVLVVPVQYCELDTVSTLDQKSCGRRFRWSREYRYRLEVAFGGVTLRTECDRDIGHTWSTRPVNESGGVKLRLP